MKVLGLDIGTHEVKTVLLDVGLFRKQVTAASFFAVAGRPLPEVVREASRGTFDVVAVSIDRKLVVTRNLTLPFRDRSQLKKVVRFEAESQLPFTAEKGYIDHHVIGDAEGGGTEVLVVAISHRDWESMRPILEATGRTDAFHQIDSYAAIGAALDTGAALEGSVAFLDLGHSKTSLEILTDGRLRFSRCLDAGGRHLTEALGRGLELDPADLEARKIAALSGDESGAADRKLLEPAIDRLAKEVRFTFLSFQQIGGPTIARVVAVGGGSRAPALLARLSEKLGVPVTQAKPGTATPLPPEIAGDFGRYAGAYGVALRGQHGVSPLPPTKGEVVLDFLQEGRSFWQYHRKTISGAVTGALVCALAYVLIQVGQIRRLEARVLSLDQRIESDLEGINKASDLRGRKRIALSNLEAASREAGRRLELLRKGATPPLGILSEISQLVPKGTNFTMRLFILETGLVTIVAETNTNEESDQITEAIKRSQVFVGVRKTEAAPSPDNPGRVQFKVQFKVSA